MIKAYNLNKRYESLPPSIKQLVKDLLLANDFSMAKQVLEDLTKNDELIQEP